MISKSQDLGAADQIGNCDKMSNSDTYFTDRIETRYRDIDQSHGSQLR